MAGKVSMMTAVALSHPVTVPAGIPKILSLLVRYCLSHGRFSRFKRGGKTANSFGRRTLHRAALISVLLCPLRCRFRAV